MNEIKLEMREIFLKRAKYVLNPYVTRINDDGRIINSDVMEVVNLCIENNILQGKKMIMYSHIILQVKLILKHILKVGIKTIIMTA